VAIDFSGYIYVGYIYVGDFDGTIDFLSVNNKKSGRPYNWRNFRGEVCRELVFWLQQGLLLN
jgi:hypothetical protein